MARGTPTDPITASNQQALFHVLGPALRQLLDDPDVVDIHLNDDGRLWARSRRNGNIHVGHINSQQASALLSLVAGFHGKELTAEQPRLAEVLPFYGARLQAQIPPLTKAPTFALRKPPTEVFPLEAYVESGRITQQQHEILRAVVTAPRNGTAANVLVFGGTGSGKTTLANALVDTAVRCATTTERWLILEDIPEIQCAAANRVHLLTNPVLNITLTQLLHDTLRLDPDRIVVGEVRGPEALDLIKAWGTGHPGGIGTIHASDPQGALMRLDHLTQEAGVPSQRWAIAGTVQILVHMVGKAGRAQLQGITKVRGLAPEGYDLLPINTLDDLL